VHADDVHVHETRDAQVRRRNHAAGQDIAVPVPNIAEVMMLMRGKAD
jgi:hypothetical protein